MGDWCGAALELAARVLPSELLHIDAMHGSDTAGALASACSPLVTAAAG